MRNNPEEPSINVPNETCKTLIEGLPEGILLSDLEGNILLVNREACRMLDYDREELCNLNCNDLVPEGANLCLPDALDVESQPGKPLETENLDKLGNGGPVELRANIIEVEGEGRTLISIRDTSKRREREEKIKTMQERIQGALSAGNIAWWEMELPSKKVKFDDRKVTMLGYSPQRFTTYKDFEEIIHPQDREKVIHAMGEHITGDRDRYKVEYRIRKSNGSYKWFRDIGSVTERDGDYVKLTGMVIDIDERKKYEKILEMREKELNGIVSNTADAIGMIDEQGRIRFWNEKAVDMFGYAADEAYGELIDALIMPDKHVKRFRRAFHKFCKTGEDVEMSHTVEMTAKRRDGTTFPVEISHSSFELEDELHAVAIIRDISEKKQTEQQLQKEREKSRQLHGSVDKLQQRETEEEVLETAIEVAEKVLDFDQCANGILEGDYVVPKAVSSGLSPDKSARLNVGEGITGKAIELGETIWGDDMREHPDARPTHKDFRSFINAPIGDVDNLQIVATEVGSFDQGDVDLLEILTGHIQEEIHRVRLENELKEQAIKDPLTNLYNRRYLANVMNKEAERAKRYEKPIAFIMIDINGFKTVNDELSHRTGDRVLGEIAFLLKENVRNADTVVRYGGDEFLIMMPETDGEAHTTVKRLKKEMEKWNENCDLIEGFSLSLAMGVSHWDRERSIDIERALMEADKRMYEDKRDGGPRRERVYPTTGK